MNDFTDAIINLTDEQLTDFSQLMRAIKNNDTDALEYFGVALSDKVIKVFTDILDRYASSGKLKN